jgi:ankyrin repeat protein
VHWAAQNGQVDAIKTLKEAGGDVSGHDQDGWTPMHYSALNGHVEDIEGSRCRCFREG